MTEGNSSEAARRVFAIDRRCELDGRQYDQVLRNGAPDLGNVQPLVLQGSRRREDDVGDELSPRMNVPWFSSGKQRQSIRRA